MEDERLVRLAQDHGYVTAGQVAKALEEKRQLADRGIERSVWFLLQDLGFIADHQIQDLRKYVSSTQVRALEVDGYTLQGRLGSGGMGDVFRAVDGDSNAAAVKLLSSRLAHSVEHTRRFHREARATLRLRHPHITRTLGSGELDGQCYLIMELVPGPSLKLRVIEHGRLSLDEALTLLWQMAQALRHAWHRGVLHRDVKPANIILAPPRPGVSEPFCAKLCDFGLAKVWSDATGEPDDSRGQLTGTGMALGTPHYMAPEQASGEQDLDQRADIYSLGASLYHALLGQTMYSGRSSTAIMYKQVTEDVDLEPLRKLSADAGIIQLLTRMLNRRRDRRIASWEDVLAAAEVLAPGMAQTQQAALDGCQLSSASSTLTPGVGPIDSSDSHSPALTPRATRKPAVLPLTLILALASAVVLMLALGLLLAVGNRDPVPVSPATFAAALASSDSRSRILELAPGIYPGPWRLGIAQAGMTLRATGAGVRLTGFGDQPALRLEPGLKDTLLSGLTLVNPDGVALEVLGGAEARLDTTSIEGSVVVAGGMLTANRLRVQGGIEMDSQGALSVTDGFLSGKHPLRMRSGSLLLLRCRIAGGGPDAALLALQAGRAEMDAVELLGSEGASTGLRLAAGVQVRLTDVAVAGVALGLEADGALIHHIDGLSLSASVTGLRWTGPRDPAWTWSGLAVQAPTPIDGPLTLIPGSGARRERLPAPGSP